MNRTIGTMKSCGLYKLCLSTIKNNSKQGNEIFSLLSNSINTNNRKISPSLYDALRKIVVLLFTQIRRTVAYTRSITCYHSRTGIRAYKQQPRAACVIHWNTFTISIERKCDCILWIFKDYIWVSYCDLLHTLSYKHTQKSYLFSSIQT